MLKNYLRTSFRYLSKNKAYTTINVLGLAVGMACFLLLTIFVKHEFSYDEYHSKKDQIFQVYMADTSRSDYTYKLRSQAPMAPMLVETVPDIVNATRFFFEGDRVIRVNQESFLGNRVHFADKQMFEMFDIPFATTDQRKIEFAQNEILMSAQQAIRLFGSVDGAIGKELEIVDLGKYVVKEVFEDLPENTHLELDFILSFDGAQTAFAQFGDRSIFEWGFLSAFPAYVELASDETNIDEVVDKIQAAIAPHISALIQLKPLNEIYFKSDDQYPFGKRGNKQYAQLYLIIAFLILIIAAVNYINMATARLSKRSKEVGIRKTVGGNRSQIVRQFLIESIVISSMGLILAICLAEMSLPYLGQLVDKSLDINYQDPLTISFFIGAWVFVGVISGAYPALYLSRFNPIQVLSGANLTGQKGGGFRRLLVGFQFFTCLGLLTTTAIVFKQFKHMQTLELGFNQEQLISVDLRDSTLRKNYEGFKAEILRNPNIESVVGASYPIFRGAGAYYFTPDGFEESIAVAYLGVEANFLDDMGISMNIGEGFSREGATINKDKLLINKTAQETFNWDKPIGETMFGNEVIGVVDDFIFASAKEAVSPLMLWIEEDDFSQAYIRLSANNIASSLEHIQGVFDNFSDSYSFEYSFLDDEFARKYEKEQKLSKVFSTFSVLAIFVAGLGILGLSIFVSEQRIKEIGIRRVLGAKVSDIVWLLNRNTTFLIIAVAIVVLPIVHYIMGSWLEEFNNRIEPGISYYLIPFFALLTVVWLILLHQSIKSARQNPVNALRTE